jgi:hypothetical protein
MARRAAYFERSVFQTGLGHSFQHFLELPKDEAIAALALDITPDNGGDEVKEASPEASAKAKAWYKHVSPIVAAWLEKAVPKQKYKNLFVNAPMGDV